MKLENSDLISVCSSSVVYSLPTLSQTILSNLASGGPDLTVSATFTTSSSMPACFSGLSASFYQQVFVSGERHDYLNKMVPYLWYGQPPRLFFLTIDTLLPIYFMFFYVRISDIKTFKRFTAQQIFVLFSWAVTKKQTLVTLPVQIHLLIWWFARRSHYISESCH